MDLKIEWSPTAKLDFKDIILFIAENNPLAANQFRNRILNHIKQLPKFPVSGRVVPEFQEDNIREIIQSPYRIVYRIKKNKNVIEILRIWHAARGIPNL
ncbi:MAG: type II toxin-antitoxin system RelE/ParE family toxin [Colwellia sp.]|nr:type II toxin-antitoxin system RelE/ParE family toxin [Colwellia sp.]